MEIIYPRCCGVDVHKRELVACVVTTDPDGTPRKAVRGLRDHDSRHPGAGGLADYRMNRKVGKTSTLWTEQRILAARGILPQASLSVARGSQQERRRSSELCPDPPP